MSDIQSVRPDAHHKLVEAGIEKWSRVKCPANRYNYMTSNSVKSINALTKEVRKIPITVLMDWYRDRLRKWYYELQEKHKDSHDEELTPWASAVGIQSFYTFYKMMNEMIRNKLEVATMQYQNEVNEIHAEKIAKNANPLALVVCTQQYPNDHYQPPKPHKTYAPSSKHTPSTRSHAPTRNKGKEIAKPITPPSESASKEDEDSDPEQAQRDKDRQKNLALIAKYIKNIYKPTNNNLRTSSNTRNKNVATSPKTKNNSQTRQFGNQRTVIVAGARETVGNQETKTGKRYAYHKEKMMLCKQEEKGVPLSAEQGDWRDGTDEEPDEQELEAHYKHGKDSGLNCRFRTYLDVKQLEQEHANQNAEEYEDERVVIANLIANLRLNHDENKKIQKQLKKANAADVLSVAERKNRTLIEAARTMLADSLLPIIFWAKAVNTTCYVLNRVLVTKPHNKPPYELIIGRAPNISFMRPFRCLVTILNTLDPLGKFDRKAKEGFLVRYSIHNKAFRLFNSETRKVEENLHVNILENKPNVAGQGPNWHFDIDFLTNSMNYQPVTTGNQTNKNAGPQETNGNTDDKAEDDTVDDNACKTVQEPANEYDQALKNVLDKMMDQEKEATEQSDAVRKEFEAQCDSQLLQEKISKVSSTNSFNTVSTPINTASVSRTFSPVGPSSGPSFVPFGGSFPIDVANLPHDPLMPELEDTAEI
ncbi:putative ribonuclease H-like domain-containing protein [Tanacetum coccineum]